MRGPDRRTMRARSLRRAATQAELKRWNHLRSRALGGCKLARQEPIGPFIVDFVCRERRLVVEVDGGQHATARRDPARDQWLADPGYRVLRFRNNDVLGNLGGVLETIARALEEERPPHPPCLRAALARRPLPARGER